MLNCIQRLVDAAWAHSAGIEMLDKVLFWITLFLTVIIFIWHYVGYWRTSKRLFWRMLRRWSGGLTIGVVCAVILVLLMHYAKGDDTIIDNKERVLILSIFAAGGLMWGVARYKYNHWRKDE
ncbi:MAG: hypothetical protein IJ378_04265 [Alistipes sp.]|nr:hypothetical protein [Alistipes sp.]